MATPDTTTTSAARAVASFLASEDQARTLYRSGRPHRLTRGADALAVLAAADLRPTDRVS